MYDRDKTIQFEIVTPERVVFRDEISQVTVPTKEGEITVLPKHMPLISILVPGVLELKTKEGNTQVMSVSGGFVKVLLNKVVILADTAERAEELELEKVEEARERAEKAMQEVRHEDVERFANISASLARELARTKAIKRWRGIKK